MNMGEQELASELIKRVDFLIVWKDVGYLIAF